MKLRGHTSPEMTRRYLEIALPDLPPSPETHGAVVAHTLALSSYMLHYGIPGSSLTLFCRGAEYVEMAGPNFAGHYRVVNWAVAVGI